MVKKQEGKTFNGVHPKLDSKIRLPTGSTCRQRDFSQGLLIHSSQRQRAKVCFTGSAADLLGLWCMYVCRALRRETWCISNFRVKGNSKLMKRFRRKGYEVESFEGEGWKRGNGVNVEIDLWTPLALAAATEPSCIYCLDHGINLRGERGFRCVYPKENGPVLSTEAKTCTSWRLVWACCISGKAWSHASEVSSPPPSPPPSPISYIALNNLIHSSLSSWAVIDLSVI